MGLKALSPRKLNMKNLLWMGLLFVLTAFPVQAEVVQTVNFNPARLGIYERLIVSDTAVFKGGLLASSMQIRSNGTVTIYGRNEEFAYDIKTLNAKDGTANYVGDSFPSKPTLDFPNMCFSSLENCVDVISTGALKLKFNNGGAAKFKPTSTDARRASRIYKITTQADRLDLDSVYAKITGKLNVTSSVKLAGNTIPNPNATSGTLAWEDRKTVRKSSGGGKTVKVLALKASGGVLPNCVDGKAVTNSCSCPGTEVITYGNNTRHVICRYNFACEDLQHPEYHVLIRGIAADGSCIHCNYYNSSYILKLDKATSSCVQHKY